MESWTPDRIHRFKNILAFLVTSFCDYRFVDVLLSKNPSEIEQSFMKYLGPELPTPYEYSHGLSETEEKFFEKYCEKYSPSASENE